MRYKDNSLIYQFFIIKYHIRIYQVHMVCQLPDRNQNVNRDGILEHIFFYIFIRILITNRGY